MYASLSLDRSLTDAARHESRTGHLGIAASQVSAALWDDTLAQFAEASVEQSAAFSALRWPACTQERFVFRRGGQIVGGALILVSKLPLGLFSIALGKWAPLLARTSAHPGQDYRDILGFLTREYAGRGMPLCLLPRAHPDEPHPAEASLNALGFVKGNNVSFPNRYLVNLTGTEEDQRRGLASKWRYNLKRAESLGLSFDEGTPDQFAEFDALYREMSDRKKFPDYAAYNTVPAMMKFQDAALRPRLFFVRSNGKPVAGALISVAGETAAYLYGATNADALSSRAGYVMQWNIIRWLRANTGARWYDLGGCDGFSGLHQFKKGLVGDTGRIVSLPPLYYHAEQKLAKFCGKALFTLREKFLRLHRHLRIASQGLARPDLTPGQ